jgi:hypothetical protein
MEENKVSEEKKSKKNKEKKPVTFKQMIIRRLIFIVIFLIIAILITVYFVSFNKKDKKDKEELDNNKVENVDTMQSQVHQGLIDLDNDTYNINDLNIIQYSGEYDGLEYDYYQIDGLSDNSIEVSINYCLKNDIEKSIQKAIDENKINRDNFSVSIYLASNFANTISISYTINSYNYDENTYEADYLYNDYIGENFDLTTGNRIEITDIFTEDTTGQMLFNSNFYNELIPSYTEQTMDEDEWYLKVTDYNDIEEGMLDLINKYNNKREIAFIFDEQEVNILEYYASIYYEDFLDYVAIYNKYNTDKTIFDGKYDKLKNIPVLEKRSDAEYQIIEQGDNYYIDISLSNVYVKDWRNETVYNAVKETIQNEINQIKEEASQKSAKFIIANYYYYLSANTVWVDDKLEMDGDFYSCNYTKLRYETTKSMFKSELHDKIIEIFRTVSRTGSGEAYLYDNLFLYYFDDAENVESEYDNFSIDNNGLIYYYEDQDDMIWDIID